MIFVRDQINALLVHKAGICPTLGNAFNVELKPILILILSNVQTVHQIAIFARIKFNALIAHKDGICLQLRNASNA